jgi:reverse gyrase
MTEARRADRLMIWTDCDREGEHIGSEIASVCRRSNPRIIVKRARFSAIIARSVCIYYSEKLLYIVINVDGRVGRFTKLVRIQWNWICGRRQLCLPE